MTNRIFAKIPARHVLCVMFLTGFIFVFMIRVNINLAIVGMVRSPRLLDSNVTEKAADMSVFEEEAVEVGEFEWDEFQQGLILGAFFYGYMTSQIPGGRVAELYGMKPVFGLGVLINGLLALLIPFSVRLHWILLFLTRVLQGLAQGVMYPALSACVAKWVPMSERARFFSITVQAIRGAQNKTEPEKVITPLISSIIVAGVWGLVYDIGEKVSGSGCSVGPVVALPLCGWILTTWGWPAVFYTTGAFAVVWYAFWMFLVYDTPEQHPRITLEEKKFLDDNLKEETSKEVHPLPWGKALTSCQFWLGAAAHVGSDWGFHTFYTYGPKYIKDALNFDISQSAVLSSLPFLCQYISANVIAIVVDRVLIKYKIPLRRIRKVSVFFSHCMPGILVILLTFIGHDVILSLVVFTLAVSMLGALTTGHYQNPIDIAPNFAGSLTGVANSLGSLGGILCTTIAGASLQHHGSPKGWHAIFYVAAAVYAMTSVPFIIWIKSEVLPWNTPEPKAPVELKLMSNHENGNAGGKVSKNIT